MLPAITVAEQLVSDRRRLLIAAYGFEDRSLGWVHSQKDAGCILSGALIFRYVHSKGRNRVSALRKAIVPLGVTSPLDACYNLSAPHSIEDSIGNKLAQLLPGIDEVIVDVSAMTKLLLLVTLCKLAEFPRAVRIVYAEPDDYAPTRDEYESSKDLAATFPSRGFGMIVRTGCLSSIRMQGQPVSMVAFTSFNEQLVGHMLGTISPHRLLFINGRPPRDDYSWRERATQEIHQRLINEYPEDNPLDERGLLVRSASTLDYRQTFERLEEIYGASNYERIIVAATGSKMQMLGLFLSKIAHPDIHIEYPTPDSYLVSGISRGVRRVHQVVFPSFARTLKSLKRRAVP